MNMQIRLPDSTNSIVENYSMINDSTGKYWYHLKPRFPDSHPTLYKKIISEAERSIRIWDPHIHENKDCVIFTEVKNNIAIEILTLKSLNGTHANFMTLFVDEMKKVIPVEKSVSFCLGVIDKYTNKEWEFHDRFLIIDRFQVYLVGGSVEYNHTSKMGSGIYKVTDTITSQFIIDLFAKYWNETIKLPETIQLLYP